MAVARSRRCKCARLLGWAVEPLGCVNDAPGLVCLKTLKTVESQRARLGKLGFLVLIRRRHEQASWRYPCAARQPSALVPELSASGPSIADLKDESVNHVEAVVVRTII